MYEIKKNILQEMEYTKEPTVKMLYNDYEESYHFYVLSMGSHPTAYVEVPKDFKKINELGVSITYDSTYLNVGTIIYKDSRFIGWDYAHASDYVEGIHDGKKWTTEEIIHDCINVINKIITKNK